ncbi:hypothetical protein [Haloglomus halophilum]|uniref:hypothetical protein n=1 Tax=Haloglomus halophilum TaxID=2962672 RepID=UPI0020C9529F|nr:hypothetical protein [Haloglomus halophilum]
MTGTDDLQETTTFDEGGFIEISIDGRRVARLEEISDLKKSVVDRVVMVRVLERMVEGERAALEEELDREPDEILAEVDPTIEFYNSDEVEWEQIRLD